MFLHYFLQVGSRMTQQFHHPSKPVRFVPRHFPNAHKGSIILDEMRSWCGGVYFFFCYKRIVSWNFQRLCYITFDCIQRICKCASVKKKKQFFCINFYGGALATWNVRHVLRVVRYIKWCNRALEKGCPWSTFPCPFVTIHRDGIFCFVRKLGCIQLALVNKGQDLEIQTRRQIKKPHFSLKELCWIYTMLK